MNRVRPCALIAALAAVVLLGGCKDAAEGGDPLAEIDPAVGLALNDQLMADPDLVSLNQANAALTRSSDQSVPRHADTPEAIRKAQDRAVAALGGTRSVPDLPPPLAMDPEGEDSPLVLLEDVARELPGSAVCIDAVRIGAGWAARLPDGWRVFPRGTVQEALGADKGECRIRAVRFRSAVPADDIARFYFGSAQSAGFAPRYAASDTGWQITGAKGAAHFIVRSRPSVLGHQEIDLVTLGGQSDAPAAARPR